MIEDYLLLMFSMKPEGKRVDFNHIKEKVERDLKVKDVGRIRRVLQNLVERGFLEEKDGLYSATRRGRNFFAQNLRNVEKELEKRNSLGYLTIKIIIL